MFACQSKLRNNVSFQLMHLRNEMQFIAGTFENDNGNVLHDLPWVSFTRFAMNITYIKRAEFSVLTIRELQFKNEVDHKTE